MATAPKDALQMHVTDILALERHIQKAFQRQRDDDELKKEADANQLVIRLERTTSEHVKALEALAGKHEASTTGKLKKAVANALGQVAGIYDQTREHPVSRMLRDNYTSLSLAAMGYTAMHAYGLAVKEPAFADLAQKHLTDYTPLMVELSKELPKIVVRETVEAHGAAADASAAEKAVENTQYAWGPEVTSVG